MTATIIIIVQTALIVYMAIIVERTRRRGHPSLSTARSALWSISNPEHADCKRELDRVRRLAEDTYLKL